MVLRCLDLEGELAESAARTLAREFPDLRVEVRREGFESHLRINPSAGPEVAAHAEAALRRLLGPAVFDDESFPAAVVHALRAAKKSVALAESLTAGLASSLLAEVPGASEVLEGAMVTYSTELKARWLGVPRGVLAEFGPVSEPTARAMAEGVLARSGADLAVALTGWAGPEPGADGQPAGTVYLALADPAAATHVEHRLFSGDRDEVRRKAALRALDLLRRRALGRPA